MRVALAPSGLDSFMGELRSAAERCGASEKIVVMESLRGRDRIVARTRAGESADRDGDYGWSVEIGDRAGRFYAVARAHTDRRAGLCEAARSQAVNAG